MTTTESAASLPAPPPRSRWIAGAAVVVALGLAAWQSRIALLLWALDGVLAIGLLGLATFAGLGLLTMLRLGPLSAAWRWLLAAGLGVGLLATLMLVLGSAGLIGPRWRWLLAAVLGVLAVGGLATLARKAVATPPRRPGAGSARWLWLLAAPFAALVLLVATMPPGLLWQEEGMGYDVLEYHLQAPKEYYQAGAIHYLPHNVYANFPSNAEMLYLAACTASGDPIEFWSVAKCLNAALAVLLVAAAWLACRELSPQAGVVGGVLTAITGWVTYLSGIAYVENGMLLMGMLALACLLRSRSAADRRVRLRWIIAAGLLAGLACGFKYPAVPLIAIPLLLVLISVDPANWRRRVTSSAVYALAAAAGFSPWLIKNTVMTGNPVFPLMDGVFHGYPSGWGPQEAAHFAAAHAPAGAEATLGGRLAALGGQVVLDPAQRFGSLLLVLAIAGLVRRPDRLSLGLALALAVQLGVWLFATHLYARFAVPLLLPLIVLGARGAVDAAGRLRGPLALLIVVGAGVNLYHTARLYHAHVYYGGERLDAEGRTSIFTAGIAGYARQLATINADLPADAHILLVGDARAFYYQRRVDYCVVFNRCPFVEVVEKSPEVADILAWLRAKGYTHVYVDWSEIARLRRSRYDFPHAITRSLFEQLADAGLLRLEEFTFGDAANEAPFGTLYAVPAD